MLYSLGTCITAGNIAPNVKSLFDMESSALEDEILTLQNGIEMKARSTSSQPEEHVVFWKLQVADKCPNLRSCAFFRSTYLCEICFLVHKNHQVHVQI